ncbi:MAG: PEP/pyruvate-binding domain-containing protein [Acidobacteriota bacterium]
MGFLRNLFIRRPPVREVLRQKYKSFRRLLATNGAVLELITDLEGAIASGTGMSSEKLRALLDTMEERVRSMVQDLNVIAEGRYASLAQNVARISAEIEEALRSVRGTAVTPACLPLEDVNRALADAVGGKVANLGEVRNVVGLPVPFGFAVTAFAYRSFIEGAGLQGRITELWNSIDWDDLSTVTRASGEIRRLVLGAELPQDVRENITLAAHDLYRKAPGRPRISLRSSAIGEDSYASFAGQYATYLNVPLEQVLRRYRETVASKFSARALVYMHSKGFREEDLAMSVGCFLMVDAVAAGVAYSVNPSDSNLDTMVISAVWGLGRPVVDGSVTPDTYLLPRRHGGGGPQLTVVRKPTRLVAGPQEGVVEENVPEEMQDSPCLTEEQIHKLGEYVRALENHYRAPQDVEWALDRQGRLFILQTRPLSLPGGLDELKVDESALARYTVLLTGGVTACPGVGAGPVSRVGVDDDLARFPQGGVLVALQNSPRFVQVMNRAAAIVTQVGSATGHMASLTREYRVPTITNLVQAAALENGTVITVDATHCRILAGRAEELILASGASRPSQRDLPSLAVLGRIAGRITRLNLTDPSKNSFRAKNCRTYHDVVRFCHEMAISEMFNISDPRSLRDRGMAFRLQTTLPGEIYLIDLGGGANVAAGSRLVAPEQVISIPMRALYRGMTTPGVLWADIRQAGPPDAFSIWLDSTLDAAHDEAVFSESSYALVGANYVNFGSRLGYHLTTLEAVCSETNQENSIIFRFKGGAADLRRRERRVRFIGEVMQAHGFEVVRRQDLLNAWVNGLPQHRTEDLLAMLGRLIGCARQLDVVMDTEATVAACVEAFMRGDYAFFEFRRPGGSKFVDSESIKRV